MKSFILLIIGLLGIGYTGVFPPSDTRTSSGKACLGIITFDSTYVVPIHPSEPSYHIRLVQKEDRTGRSTKWCYELHAQENKEGASAQVIERESNGSFQWVDVEEYPGIDFFDLNFDSYLDIKMYNSRSPNGANVGYVIYLFDQEQRRFKYSDEFSGIFHGAWIEIKEERREITSFNSTGCFHNCWIEITYNIVNGLPIVSERRIQEDSDQCPIGFFLLKEEKLSNEALIVVKEECVQ